MNTITGKVILKYLGQREKKQSKKEVALLDLFTILTSHFVPNKFGRLHLTDAAKQTAQLILRHVLWQVIDYQVCFSIFWLVSQVAFKTVRDVVGVLLMKQKQKKKKTLRLNLTYTNSEWI